MPRLALSDDFVADLISLQRPVQKEVNDAIRMFQSMSVPQLHASKGMHLEKLERARDPRIRTIRVTRAYRGVLLAPDDGSGLFTLLRVAPHDEAINWACKRAYSVNSATGGWRCATSRRSSRWRRTSRRRPAPPRPSLR